MIVAVDFDGVLCEDKFPDIGEPIQDTISLVRQMIEVGIEVVLWTCRAGSRLEEAVNWCERVGLEFCAVNDNAPSNRARYESEYPMGTRKVYADVYFDDKTQLDYINGYDASVTSMVIQLGMFKVIAKALAESDEGDMK